MRAHRLIAILLSVSVALGCGDDDSKSSATVASDAGVDSQTPDADITDTNSASDSELVTDSSSDAESSADAELDADPNAPPAPVREMRPASTGDLQAGVAFGRVSPPAGVSMAGFGGRVDGPSSTWSGDLKASQGFYDTMAVKAIALDVEGERLVILKMPTMSSEHTITEGIIAKLKADHDLDLTGRILTGACHSHHTAARYWRLPSQLGIIGIDSFDPETFARMVTVFADTIKAAIDNLGAAEWAFAYQDDWDPNDDIYRDRRSVNDPTYPKDPRLSLLAVRRPDGTPMATVINFGIHGTVFGDSNDLITEDAVGGVERKFEAHFFKKKNQPIIGMVIQSAGGDASPAGDRLNHSGFARVEKLGEDAAPRILALYDQLEWKRELSLAVRSRRIDLRYSWMGYDDYPEFLDAQGNPYTWGGWQCSGAGGQLEGNAKLCVPLDVLLGGLGEPIPHPEVHQTYLTVARLDNLFAVSIPGEPTYSVVKYLREQISAREMSELNLDVMAFGYAQDHLLYFTHPDDWFKGDYESEMSLWGPLAGKYLIDRQLQLVDDMLNGFHGPAWYEESPSLSTPIPEYTPRELERSIEPGSLQGSPPAAVSRTETLRISLSAGDPSLGSPHVVLQRQEPGGGFIDLSSPSGHPGEPFDNNALEMMSIYNPEPPISRDILPERRHAWTIQWQIPADFPAGTYRLRANGSYWDGDSVQAWDLSTEGFTIRQSAEAELLLSREGDLLSLLLSLPATPKVNAEGKRWPKQGWRLLDPSAGPDAKPTVRVPVVVTFAVGESPLDMGADPIIANFDVTRGRHTLDLSSLPIDLDSVPRPNGATLTLQVHQNDDLTPSLTAPRPLP